MAGVSETNKRAWSSWFAGLDYQQASHLHPAEQAVLDKCRKHLEGRRILDIGIGTGRTTSALHRLTREYVGFDYSVEMVKRARSRFPGIDIRHMDARDLTAFADGSFDSVWFSFNGIDYVSHEDRMTVLEGVRRILSAEGWLYFSTHNRDWTGLDQPPTRAPAITWTSHPAKLAYRVLRHVRSRRNLQRLRDARIETPEFAILNDAAHDYSLMHYHISLPAQARQLQRLGFGDLQALDDSGHALPLDRPHQQSASLHFLAQKR